MAWRGPRSFKGLQLIPPFSSLFLLLFVSPLLDSSHPAAGFLSHARSVAAASLFHQGEIAHLKSH